MSYLKQKRKQMQIILSFLMMYVLFQTSIMGDSVRANQLNLENSTNVSNTISEDSSSDDLTDVGVDDVLPTIKVTSEVTRASDITVQEQVREQREIIQTEQERIRLEQEAIIQAEKARIDQINSITADTNDVSKISNMTEEQFKIATKGTWLEGREQVFIDLERRFGINAFFAMSVTTLESGHGTSDYSQAYNRFYGEDTSLVPSEGLYDSTMYFGDFINRLYVDEGLLSVWAIGPKYCPPNRNWEVFMYDKMNELYNKVMSTVR